MTALTKQQFISKSNLAHNNVYNYDKVIYKNSTTKVTITCAIHGDFQQTPSRHLYGKNNCPKCNQRSSFGFLEKFIRESKIIHNNKYNYDKIVYKDSKTKVIIVCPVHGDFEQTPAIHIRNHGCPKCSYQGLDTSTFILRSQSIHGKLYDYSKTVYKNYHTRIIISCTKHGDFKQTPAKHLSGRGCPKCTSSKGELKIRKYLLDNNIHFEEQKSFPDCKYKYVLKFDFYLPQHKLLIEFNGIQHYEFQKRWHRTQKGFNISKERDSIKVRWASDNHIDLLIIPYTEIDNIDSILGKLEYVKYPNTTENL